MMTTADEKLKSAKQHIKDAAMDLACIAIDECHGHDELSQDKQAQIQSALNTLIMLKENLTIRSWLGL